MKSFSRFDVCIIGAGVAGATLAAYLGKHGLKVVVVEKSLAEQERIVGELLQPGGLLKLQEMGFEHLVEGSDAQEVEGYGLFLNNNSFKIPYSSVNGQKLSGRGFRNGKFVQQIRKYIQALPGVTVIEGTAQRLTESGGRITGIKYVPQKSNSQHIAKTQNVTALIRSPLQCDGESEGMCANPGVAVQDAVDDSDEQTISAHLTVVSDGMFSLFRENLAHNKKQVSSYFLGMILKNCKLPFKNHGHVIIARPSCCLLYPVSSSETRLLIDFPQNRAPRKSAELTGYLQNVVAPQLPSEILPSFFAALNEGAFKVMPNHHCPAKPVFHPGAVLVGDSLNMRHPLTGGGMTAAFTDIKNLGDRLINMNLENNLETDNAVKHFYATRHKQNATINILADALYGVLQDDDLKQACYRYLQRGGKYAQEPVSILSAMSRDADLLLRHFFAVAFYGAAEILKPFPTPARLKRSYKMMQSAVFVVKPLVMNEKPGMFTRTALNLAGVVFA